MGQSLDKSWDAYIVNQHRKIKHTKPKIQIF